MLQNKLLDEFEAEKAEGKDANAFLLKRALELEQALLDSVRHLMKYTCVSHTETGDAVGPVIKYLWDIHQRIVYVSPYEDNFFHPLGEREIESLGNGVTKYSWIANEEGRSAK